MLRKKIETGCALLFCWSISALFMVLFTRPWWQAKRSTLECDVLTTDAAIYKCDGLFISHQDTSPCLNLIPAFAVTINCTNGLGYELCESSSCPCCQRETKFQMITTTALQACRPMLEKINRTNEMYYCENNKCYQAQIEYEYGLYILGIMIIASCCVAGTLAACSHLK